MNASSSSSSSTTPASSSSSSSISASASSTAVPLPWPLPFASSSAARWLAAMSSVSIPASASIWWRRSSVPAAVVGGLADSTRSRPSISPYRTFQRELGSARPAAISARASSSAKRRAVPVASASAGSSSGFRNGSPNHSCARFAAALNSVAASDAGVGVSVVSCMCAARRSCCRPQGKSRARTGQVWARCARRSIADSPAPHRQKCRNRFLWRRQRRSASASNTLSWTSGWRPSRARNPRPGITNARTGPVVRTVAVRVE